MHEDEIPVERIDMEHTARYGDKWFLLRQHIAEGLARPVPEEVLLRLESDYRRLVAAPKP